MQAYADIVAARRKHVTTVLSPLPEVPWVDFYNTVAYYDVYRGDRKAFYFRLIENATQKILSVAHFTEKEPGLFASPLRGTYGGIDTPEHDILLLDIFLEDIEKMLREAGARQVFVALPPFVHDPARLALLLNVLLRRGFTITQHELNYFLTVDASPLSVKMEDNNRKRFNKCVREGCAGVEFTSAGDYEQAYNIIKTNREAKGFPVTITLDHLQLMKETFPDRWRIFGVHHRDTLVAASVCIRINARVLYVFYWGDLPEAHTLSPVAFLAHHLYQFCQREKIGLLDIGTSTDNGLPNIGLMNFKARLGCSVCPKIGLRKEL